MSIAAVSASSFCHNPAQNFLSGPNRSQQPFTLPDQVPIPGHSSGPVVQDAGTTPTLHGAPEFRVLPGNSRGPVQGEPIFNVLTSAGSSLMQGDPLFNVLALNQALPIE